MSTDFAPFAYPVLRGDRLSETTERARVSGHSAGFVAGRREAAELAARELAEQRAAAQLALQDDLEALRSAVAAANAAAARLRAESVPLLATLDASVLAAAVELAEAILARELSDAPEAALGRIRRALERAGADDPVRAVRLSPRDAELLAAEGLDLPIEADPALRPGDSLVLLADGLLDDRVSSALDRARTALGGLS
jgi:flagellar assembly protein FliH